MSEKEKLLPCPFCGGKAVFETKGNSSSHYDVGFDFTIKCNKCLCVLPKRYELRLTLGDCGQIVPKVDERKEALEAWNNRFSGTEENHG